MTATAVPELISYSKKTGLRSRFFKYDRHVEEPNKLQLLARLEGDVKAFSVVKNEDNILFDEKLCRSFGMKQSSNGMFFGFLLHPSQRLVVYRRETLQSDPVLVFSSDPGVKVKEFDFVENLSFFVFIVDLQMDSASNNPLPNLHVINLANSSAQLALSLVERNYIGPETWPLLHFISKLSSKDTVSNLCLFKTKNSLLVHEQIGSNSFELKNKIEFPGLGSVGFPRKLLQDKLKLAAFQSQSKGNPGKLLLLEVEIDSKVSNAKTVATKTLMRAQEVKFIWNPSGTHCLAKSESAEDVTGKSYYGETNLLLIDASKNEVLNVDAKSGGIKDFAWTPAGKEFIAISGTMPSLVALYNLKGEQVFKFGELHRNTVSFNPFGRFVCIAGFGNLPGEMDFWDLTQSMPIRIGGSKASCPVGFGWSPDGRLFMAASMFPRRRVDNMIQVFTYFGEKILEEKYNGSDEELYDVQWINTDFRTYRDRSRSKDVSEQKLVQSQEKYIPPNLRKQMEAAGMANIKLTTSALGLAGNDISGAELLQKRDTGPSKNQVRKEKLKQRKEKEEAEKHAPPPTNAELTDDDRAIRKLAKQLKQIMQLEERVANGEALNDEQKEKVARKSETEAELAKLQSGIKN